MVQVTIEQAEARLAELIQRAQSGEEVLIEGDGIALARISRPYATSDDAGKHKRRTPGFLSGSGFYMAEDFDAPLDDFAEYM